MTALFLIVFGVWMLGTGVHENAADATHFIVSQKSFVIWIFGLAVLFGLMQIAELKTVIRPLAVLALTALVVGRYKEVAANVNDFRRSFGIGSTPNNLLNFPIKAAKNG
jgi:hypothetical protein